MAGWAKDLAVMADGARLAALFNCVVAAVYFRSADIFRFLVISVGLLSPRWAKSPAVFDFAFGLTVWVPAWSGVLRRYEARRWWDVAVHLLTTGAIGAMGHFVFSRMGIVPDIRDTKVPCGSARLILLPLVLSAAVGVWGWFGHNHLSEYIQVGYNDMVLDLAAGTAGSLLAGGLMALCSTGLVKPARQASCSRTH